MHRYLTEEQLAQLAAAEEQRGAEFPEKREPLEPLQPAPSAKVQDCEELLLLVMQYASLKGNRWSQAMQAGLGIARFIELPDSVLSQILDAHDGVFTA